MTDTGFPRFAKKRVAPMYVPKPSGPEFRGSPRERGYDRAWDQFSVAYRRRNPFCEACEQQGVDRICDVVDHMIPLADGGDRLEVENVWSLCHEHHNRLKRDMERFARATDQVHMLPTWCRNPALRPHKFRRG